MLTLTNFLTEAHEKNNTDGKLTHLDHNEDHVFEPSPEGFQRAFHNLNDVHKLLQTKQQGDTHILVKHDGSPSIVWGYHPETKKFFVSSKSAFNKTPKINYTMTDIEQNHKRAPGLVQKLKHALRHLPKVTPKSGVYQGDLMYTRGDDADEVREDKGNYSFKPNVIEYSTPKTSEEGKKISKAKIGILAHTSYHGDSFDKMQANYTPDLTDFGQHDDVHLFNNKHDVESTSYTKDQERTFKKHMKEAVKHYIKTDPNDYMVHESHEQHIKPYINHTVKTKTTPSTAGYHKFVSAKLQHQFDSVKTAAAKGKRSANMNQTLADIEKNTEHLDKMFGMHHHLQKAKDVLMQAMNGQTPYKHSIDGKSTPPEGYVIVRHNKPSKLINRSEFSYANFQHHKNDSSDV